MGLKDAIARILIQSHEKNNLLLADLSDADLFVRPVPGANHIAWQLGHLIIQEYRQMNSQELKIDYPCLPIGFEEQHSESTASVNPPTGFLSKRAYQALGAKMHETTLANLAALSDADLEQPVKGDWGRFMRTLGDLFLGRNRSSQGHSGQFAMVRLALGKPSLLEVLDPTRAAR